MKDLLERIEELLYLQERLVNLLFLSHSQRAKISVSTAFDMLYHNIELLELIQDLLSNTEEFQEEYQQAYLMNLTLEALSWVGFILPTIEESCPIFLHSFGGKDPIQRIKSMLKALEEINLKGDYQNLIKVAYDVQSFANQLKYQIMLAKKAYTNLA
ncbi:MAG: hypothetical protein NZ531_04840 [Aquificaceae bacterium]|nr:hypothetical protein [Aquificaceae bacterium]